MLTRRMMVLGPNLGAPHTKAFGGGLFELRLKGTEGITRVFSCTVVDKRIVVPPTVRDDEYRHWCHTIATPSAGTPGNEAGVPGRLQNVPPIVHRLR